jgi:hypothetical protein
MVTAGDSNTAALQKAAVFFGLVAQVEPMQLPHTYKLHTDKRIYR